MKAHSSDGSSGAGVRTRTVAIIVNGRSKEVEGPEVCFDELLSLAFDPVPTGQFICFTVTYRRGREGRADGSLVEGDCVRVRPGMVFNVTATDKS